MSCLCLWAKVVRPYILRTQTHSRKSGELWQQKCHLLYVNNIAPLAETLSKGPKEKSRTKTKDWQRAHLDLLKIRTAKADAHIATCKVEKNI